MALFDSAIGGSTLSTGVLVPYADERSFTFMTPQGHMLGGWITFSAEPGGAGTTVQAQMLLRASDPVYEVALALDGHRKENKFWQQTLSALGSHLGLEHPEVERRVVCVDAHRQWRDWRNFSYNAAARSLGQTLAARR